MMDNLSSMESDICPIECTVEFKKYYNTKNILEKADNYLRESEIFVQSELTLGKLALMLVQTGPISHVPSAKGTDSAPF